MQKFVHPYLIARHQCGLHGVGGYDETLRHEYAPHIVSRTQHQHTNHYTQQDIGYPVDDRSFWTLTILMSEFESHYCSICGK